MHERSPFGSHKSLTSEDTCLPLVGNFQYDLRIHRKEKMLARPTGSGVLSFIAHVALPEYLFTNLKTVDKSEGSCRFRPMASSPPPSSPPPSSPPPSSPPHRLNLIEFAPYQIESHTEIIPRSFIHCLGEKTSLGGEFVSGETPWWWRDDR